jgi:hypothetical protein
MVKALGCMQERGKVEQVGWDGWALRYTGRTGSSRLRVCAWKSKNRSRVSRAIIERQRQRKQTIVRVLEI